jgi:segregation and condensation protein A
MSFSIKLETFSGPIDLLLHLVKQRELPLEKLSLQLVAEQYYALCISGHIRDYDTYGEYLVIAATLFSSKVHYVLGVSTEKSTLTESEEDNESEDPFDDLLLQMRELELYRSGAQQLSLRPLCGIDTFPSLKEVTETESLAKRPLMTHDALALGKVFLSVIKRMEGRIDELAITKEKLSIEDCILEIRKALQITDGCDLLTLLSNFAKNLSSLIASFLAVLELAKSGEIGIVQKEAFKAITIFRYGRGEITREVRGATLC